MRGGRQEAYLGEECEKSGGELPNVVAAEFDHDVQAPNGLDLLVWGEAGDPVGLAR